MMRMKKNNIISDSESDNAEETYDSSISYNDDVSIGSNGDSTPEEVSYSSTDRKGSTSNHKTIDNEDSAESNNDTTEEYSITSNHQSTDDDDDSLASKMNNHQEKVLNTSNSKAPKKSSLSNYKTTDGISTKSHQTTKDEDSIVSSPQKTKEYSNISNHQSTDDDMDVSVINSSNDSRSNSNFSGRVPQLSNYVTNKKTNSLPSLFMNPLARSSILPVPKNVLEKPRQFTTKFLPVPKDLLNKKPKDEVIVLESSSESESDDDVIVEDSFNELNARTMKRLNVEPRVVTVVETSESSSSGVSSTGSNISERKDTLTVPHSTSSNSVNNFSGSSQRSVASSNTSTESQSEMKQLKRQFEEKSLAYRNLVYAQKNCDPKKLKDGGYLLKEKVERCRIELEELKKKYDDLSSSIKEDDIEVITTVKKDIIFSSRDQNIAHLGHKAMETHRIEKALTMDALVSLHSSLATTPKLDAMEEPPAGLNISLMPHQRQALSWLLHREKQNPSGGILADDMGLGKTLTMIALVMRSAELRQEENPEPPAPWKSKASGPGHPGKTLVVCPASLVGQWESQVKEHVRRGRLSTLVHHGTNREGRGSKLMGFDIVITTYGVISQENKTKIGVFRLAWDRVILDEAHAIRNHKTQSAVAACEINSKYRWCLTGTPVHNKELDIYSLLKFLRCAPFDDLMVWKRWVDNKTPAGTERLNTVVKSILLRRTKEELKAEGGLIDLASKEIHSIRIELDDQEFAVYENVLNFSKTLVAQYLQQRAEKVDGGLMAPRIHQLQQQMNQVGDVKTHDILVLLLRLRQICCLPGLISAMLEEDSAATDGLDKADEVVEDLFKHMRRLTITAPILDEKPSIDINKVLLTSNPVFQISRPSTKMRMLVDTLKNIVAKNEKVVVVSQWSSFLRHLDTHLKQLKVKIATLDGSVPVKNRGPLVDQFNDPKSSLQVLLLSLTAGGVGLNLIGGNHLIIMEPHWNPQLESQACDRVYRVGQKKPVHIYKVICKDTIEERIELLQQKKLQLAENVLTGQLKKEINKLSLQDIKSLFGLDGS